MPGPPPKRSNQRRRTNSPASTKVTVPASGSVEMPQPDDHWHPIVKDLYLSLGKSGQVRFFEPSDWAWARFACEMAHRGLEKNVLSGQLMATVLQAFSPLLMTEGERRRARIELERGVEPAVPASVALMENYRRAAGRKQA